MMQEASKRRCKKIKFISLSFISKLFSQKILILEYFICYYWNEVFRHQLKFFQFKSKVSLSSHVVQKDFNLELLYKRHY